MTHAGRARVLVVDDERAFAELLAELLEQEGYAVEQAYDGEQALRIIGRGQPPDVVLSDVMLPRLSGPELVTAARRLHPSSRLPFILLSAGRDPKVSAEGIHFMPKPLDFERLLYLVKRLAHGEAQLARAS
jgi:DNA-binding response OmpR family regulator